MKFLASCFLFLTLCTTGAQAWNAAGHHIVGAIAYYTLQKDNPTALSKAVAILKHHPWYIDQTKWPEKLKGVASENMDAVIFMLASTWPDDIKSGNTGFEMHKNWHYADNPYVKPGSTVTGKPLPSPNAFDAYKEMTQVVQSNASDSAKAVALSWMLHVIGDIHQPLHSVEMYSNEFPKGDLGGNILCVTADSKSTNLHAFWDDLLGKGSLSFEDCIVQAKSLITSFPANKLPELAQNKTIEDWSTKESLAIAIQDVYQNGTLAYAVKSPEEKGCENGPALPKEYIDHAHAIAERRVALAGLRLEEYIVSNLR